MFIFIWVQVLGKIGFNFPIFLTLIHYFTAWIFMAIFKGLALLPVSPPSKTTPFSSLFFLGAVMALSTGLANTSLKFNRSQCMLPIFLTTSCFLSFVFSLYIPSMQCRFLSDGQNFCHPNHSPSRVYSPKENRLLQKGKYIEFLPFSFTFLHLITSPFGTISNCRIDDQAMLQVLALSVVSIGVAIATVADLEFNMFGACIAILWIIPSAINKILWSNLQQQSNWTALA